ncbi:MAG: cell wall hydrolase [Clostridia bacterium]|nr:cell wall hydrolase [Clostridia bacterium]
MKRVLAVALLLGLMALPRLGLMEGEDTIRLAKTIYTLGKGESYETMLDIGTVVMNRVDSPWYPDTVIDVLRQPHQFPCGTQYDEVSFQAARAVMMGRRTLPAEAVVIRAADATAAPEGELIRASGRFEFRTGR